MLIPFSKLGVARKFMDERGERPKAMTKPRRVGRIKKMQREVPLEV